MSHAKAGSSGVAQVLSSCSPLSSERRLTSSSHTLTHAYGVSVEVGSCLECEAMEEELEWALPASAAQLSTVAVVAQDMVMAWLMENRSYW